MRRLLLAALLGCAHVPPAVTPPSACVAAPPPTPEPVVFVFGGACPPAFEACVTRESALRLEAYLRAVRQYAADAWVRCR